MRRFKHLSFTDRLRIEAYTKAGKNPKEVAEIIGVHISTVYRELKRGRYEHLNTDLTTEERYSPDIAQEKYKENLSAKGIPLKIGSDFEFAEYVENKIVKEKYSPAAALGEIKGQGLYFNTSVCVTTLYSYISKGIFLELTNRALPVKGKRKRTYRKVKPMRRSKGESIENRPEEINQRTSWGHWEMDCVEGKKSTKKTLLVLTERLTRYELVIPMKDKTTASVVKALDGIEKKYGVMFKKIFKTITVDNGSEFADCDGIELSRKGKEKRTKVYYCHPYSSWERGSNETANKLIRRHLPKGTDLTKITVATVQHIETWINNYPRKIFNYTTSAILFGEYLEAALTPS
jgi:IS30 family transposase